MRVGGVDSGPHGWVVCVLSGAGRARDVTWSVQPDAAAVLVATAGCDAVGVDIPLVLPVDGVRRPAEVLASARLGSARSSLFPTPPPPVLDAGSYADACAAAQRVTGKKISVQTWNIVPKIREFQQVTLPGSVVEAHPELSFRTLAAGDGVASGGVAPDGVAPGGVASGGVAPGGVASAGSAPGRVTPGGFVSGGFASKKTARGAGQRVAALSSWVDPARLLGDLPPGARLDDVLDAAVCAWTAERVARGVAEFLGPGTDARGRSTAIVV